VGNFFVESLAIVPRATSKKEIWHGIFFGSVLAIFVSFSGSVIVFSGLVIDTADSYTADFIKKVLSVYTNSMTTIYLSLSAQVAKSTFFMKSPVC